MSDNSQIFFNKKILIYGLGKSGLSSFNFLRNKNDVYLFDDNPNLKINKSIKKKTINFKKLLKTKFDIIILDNLSNSNKTSLRNLRKILNKKIIFIKDDVRSKKINNIHVDLEIAYLACDFGLVLLNINNFNNFLAIIVFVK